jgi:hypothetical protein
LASTERADCIAHPDEKAGIKCYLINGVCHQAANRILLPAGITVNGARGYTVSNALYGVYGRIGIWPCSAPFNQYGGTTGDLPACIPPVDPTGGVMESPLSIADQLDWNYIQGVLAIYGNASGLFARATEKEQGSSVRLAEELEEFQMLLFAQMLDFYLGPMLNVGLRNQLMEVRRRTEHRRVETEGRLASRRLKGPEFVTEINQLTIEFQEQMAERMTSAQYQTLFRLRKDDRVVLADPDITKNEFGG